ncbi:unnamed protein product [Discosporangium mesarthrocarpum]
MALKEGLLRSPTSQPPSADSMSSPVRPSIYASLARSEKGEQVGRMSSEDVEVVDSPTAAEEDDYVETEEVGVHPVGSPATAPIVAQEMIRRKKQKRMTWSDGQNLILALQVERAAPWRAGYGQVQACWVEIRDKLLQQPEFEGVNELSTKSIRDHLATLQEREREKDAKQPHRSNIANLTGLEKVLYNIRGFQEAKNNSRRDQTPNRQEPKKEGEDLRVDTGATRLAKEGPKIFEPETDSAAKRGRTSSSCSSCSVDGDELESNTKRPKKNTAGPEPLEESLSAGRGSVFTAKEARERDTKEAAMAMMAQAEAMLQLQRDQLEFEKLKHLHLEEEKALERKATQEREKAEHELEKERHSLQVRQFEREMELRKTRDERDVEILREMLLNQAAMTNLIRTLAEKLTK